MIHRVKWPVNAVLIAIAIAPPTLPGGPAPESNRAGRDGWSLQPLVPPKVPGNAPGTSPIDAFILDRLKAGGLNPPSPANRQTLIRRLSFDLLGLPPTPKQTADFIADLRPDAYERLVDAMLASPHYGERWARHWMDVARYGESDGFERDGFRPNAWRYRDWLIDAFNADMPYDEFARMQIAGDVLRPGDAQGVIATGFLVCGAYDEVGQKQQSAAMRAVVRQDEMEDLVGTTTQTFLALTANCARCHDHKFDPIPQAEYYRLVSSLAGVQHGDRDITGEPLKHAAEDRAAAIQVRIDLLTQQVAAVAVLNPVAKAEIEQLNIEIGQIRSQQGRARATRTYAVVPGPVGPTHVLRRGNPAQEAERVTPGGVAAVPGVAADFGLSDSASDRDRRMKLAKWLSDERNPLFARVIVNRLWQYHFGRGIVETANDFGFNGGRPSHPELLDWLATELIARHWSLKQIQRLIVCSATYRQSSELNAEAARIDPDNRLLWRQSPRRLEAESLRDTMLSVAGELDPRIGGPGYEDFHTFTHNTQFYEPRDFVGGTFNRRSVYRTWVRSGRNPLLDVFDCPDPSTRAPRRALTITPLQALALMNDSFVLRMSDRFAQRLQREAGPELDRQVTLAYQLAFARAPDAEEVAASQRIVGRDGLPALCRVLFNCNEFAYVD